jgi:hypothetical protein
MDWNDYDTEELASIYSDYHKDVHGVRPRGIPLDNRGDLIEGLQGLDRYMDNMMVTPEGRARLRAEGWLIPEDD